MEKETDGHMKFRFSIRDLLWLTALASVLVAWFIDRWSHKDAVEERRAIRREYAWLEAQYTNLKMESEPPPVDSRTPPPLPPLPNSQ
jgi:hypothetical protein